MADPTIDLRLGDWRTALADVERADVIITDPFYSARTAEGYRTGSDVRKTNLIDYGCFTPADATDLMNLTCRLKTRWVVAFNDHVGWSYLERECEGRGDFYSFAPLPWVKTDAPPRMAGDGPASQTEWIFVARPRQVTKCGSLPGYYIEAGCARGASMEHLGLVGQKPLALMRRIVRDYTSRGDLIVDPYAGMATTALACRAEGRHCITAERDRETYEKARRRIEHGAIAARDPRMLPLPFGEQS